MLPRPLLSMPEGVQTPRPAPRANGGPFLYPGEMIGSTDWQNRFWRVSGGPVVDEPSLANDVPIAALGVASQSALAP